MKKYVSMLVAAIMVALYVYNYNVIFGYEDIKESSFKQPYIEDLSILDGDYSEIKEYTERPSIENLVNNSSNIGESNMQFNKPDEFKDLSELDNQRIFFFGRIDPDAPLKGEESPLDDGEFPLDGWDEWWNGDTNYNGNEGNTEGGEGTTIDFTEPIEVDLDRFLNTK